MAFFSIIIPIYNVKPYLDECLSSVEMQSFSDFEAILINDGSNDGSREIAQKYASKDPRFILIDQENMGLSEARNTALKFLITRENLRGGDIGQNQSAPSYILFLDSDDYIKKDSLKKIFHMLQKKANGVDVLKYSYEFMPKKPIPKHFTPALYQNGIDFILQHPSVLSEGCVWLYVISFKFLLAHHFSFIPRIYFEDMPFIADILVYAKSIYICDDPFYIYRLREDSITNAQWDEKRTLKAFESYLAILEHHHNLMNNMKNKKARKILKGLIQVYIWSFHNKARQTGHKATPSLYQRLHIYEQICSPISRIKIYFPKTYQTLRSMKHLIASIFKKSKTKF